jgi:hypothetical protein
LTPPGQAIFVRGMEIVKVMTPYLPDEERAQRLAKLREGEINLTEFEEKPLRRFASCKQRGKKLLTKLFTSW